MVESTITVKHKLQQIRLLLLDILKISIICSQNNLVKQFIDTIDMLQHMSEGLSDNIFFF